jgi:hypothetical protein
MPRRFIPANEQPHRKLQSSDMENRKRIYVGPPLKKALDARPKREASDVVNTLVARYSTILFREIALPQGYDSALGLLAKWSLVVNKGNPMPSSYEDVMLVPARIELMIGKDNAAECENIALLRTLTYGQLVSMLDMAEGMGS